MFITSGIYFPGGWEMVVILIIALLIFGKRLPEVGKSLGQGLVEFKKGLKGVQVELEEVERDADAAAAEKKDPPKLT